MLDWSGGDNYAIRRIHPNLIQTEGSFLSTKTTDVMGKTPYLTELEGIRDHGELFFQYHFKRKESDEVSEKLAYAVLYPDYNWIVAMGIHVDDIDYYVREVEKSSEDLNRHVLAVSSLILLAFFLFAAFFLDVSWRSFIEFRTRKIRKESNIDPLIGALNRRIGEEYFTGAFRRFRQGRASPVIFSVDIDDFKKVNDTWGHRVGDEVLKGVVERIKRTMRDSDYLFRWGGEEFLVVYESFRAMDMLQVADRLIHEVSSSPVTVAPDVVIAVDGSSSPAADSAEVFADGDLDIRVTVSTGISWFSPSDSSWEDAVTRSDRALYRAKAEGKNCSRMEPPGGSE